MAREDADTAELLGGSGRTPEPRQGAGRRACVAVGGRALAAGVAGLPARELADLIEQLTDQMHAAAEELQFEVAARLRDEVSDLKKELRQMMEATR